MDFSIEQRPVQGQPFVLRGAFGAGIQTNIPKQGVTFRRPNSNQDFIGFASTVTGFFGDTKMGLEMALRYDPDDENQLDIELFKFMDFGGTIKRRKITLPKSVHHPPARVKQNGSTVFNIPLTEFMEKGAGIIKPKNSFNYTIPTTEQNSQTEK